MDLFHQPALFNRSISNPSMFDGLPQISIKFFSVVIQKNSPTCHITKIKANNIAAFTKSARINNLSPIVKSVRSFTFLLISAIYSETLAMNLKDISQLERKRLLRLNTDICVLNSSSVERILFIADSLPTIFLLTLA